MQAAAVCLRCQSAADYSALEALDAEQRLVSLTSTPWQTAGPQQLDDWSHQLMLPVMYITALCSISELTKHKQIKAKLTYLSC